MANVLNKDKQIQIIGGLAEGNSIRSLERQTGVHRDTIMRLGVRAGQGSAKLLDAKMVNLTCNNLQMDELWGFIGCKERTKKAGICTEETYGDIWTFCCIDRATKLVPSYRATTRHT